VSEHTNENPETPLDIRPPIRQSDPNMETPQVIDKIKKLLASAGQKDNANEAAAAFARAQALATKHRIELAEIALSDGAQEADPMDRETVTVGKRVAGWTKTLLASMDTFGVYVVFLQGKGAYTFAGKSADVRTAVYMFSAISAEIERLAREHARGKGREYVNAFKLGAADTVADRLREAHEAAMQDARAAGASSTAIACVVQGRDQARSWYASTLAPGQKITKSTGCSRFSSAAGLAAGQEAGKSIDIGGKRGALGRGNRALPA
jgi:hypothetical protein